MAGDFGLDGTRALPPLPLFSDPAAGLITGASYVVGDQTASEMVVPAGPPALDPEAVQAALREVIAQEEKRRQLRARKPHRPTSFGPLTPIAPAAPTGPAKQAGSAGCIGVLITLLVVGIVVFAVVQSLLH